LPIALLASELLPQNFADYHIGNQQGDFNSRFGGDCLNDPTHAV
jgi:hypothetical protein